MVKKCRGDLVKIPDELGKMPDDRLKDSKCFRENPRWFLKHFQVMDLCKNIPVIKKSIQ